MEFIKENQFRISIIIIMIVSFLALIYIFMIANSPFNFKVAIKNPVNYAVIVLVYIVAKQISPLINEVWTQTDIQDDIHKQTSIKLELENIKSLRDLGFEVNEVELSKETKKMIKPKSTTSQPNQP